MFKNGYRRYKYLVVKADRTFFTNEETSAGKKGNEILICQMIHLLIGNIIVHYFTPLSIVSQCLMQQA